MGALFPQTRRLPRCKTQHTRHSARGRKRKRVKGRGKVQADSQGALGEAQDVAAKSHPAAGTLRASSRSLEERRAGATTAVQPACEEGSPACTARPRRGLEKQGGQQVGGGRKAQAGAGERGQGAAGRKEPPAAPTRRGAAGQTAGTARRDGWAPEPAGQRTSPRGGKPCL